VYSAIEAELRNGKLVPAEPGTLPASGKVLVIVLSSTDQRPNWEQCRREAGWLRTDIDAATWERRVRGEWGHRP